MILTDIYIPAVDDHYEISEMIAKKVKEKKPGRILDFVLYSRDSDTMLDQNRSLFANGVHDGSRLILV